MSMNIKEKLKDIIEEGGKQIEEDVATCLDEMIQMKSQGKVKENIDAKEEFVLHNNKAESKSADSVAVSASAPVSIAGIKKRCTVYWWIAEGLVKPTTYETAEQVGEECFKMLLLSGLILPVSKKHDTIARCCKLQSGVGEMINPRANEVLRFQIYSQEELASSECPVSCINATENKQSIVVSLGSKPNELLSLFSVSTEYLICDQEKFSRLESIVTLQLGRWQPSAATHHVEIKDTKFLDNLKVMKNLKYLSLKGISTMVKLPDSLSHLTNLQILDIQACDDLETLPAVVVSLKNLTHLDLSKCSLLDRMPKGLGSLSELQVLKGFIISHGRIQDPCHLKELRGIKKFSKLSINIASEAEANVHLNELDKKSRSNFSSSRLLTIAWGRITRRETEKNSLKISLLDLEKLDLQCVPHEAPDWLQPSEFGNLKKLYIRGGRMRELNLGKYRDKWNVETLRLKFLRELERDITLSELKKAFPSLDCI